MINHEKLIIDKLRKEIEEEKERRRRNEEDTRYLETALLGIDILLGQIATLTSTIIYLENELEQQHQLELYMNQLSEMENAEEEFMSSPTTQCVSPENVDFDYEDIDTDFFGF